MTCCSNPNCPNFHPGALAVPDVDVDSGTGTLVCDVINIQTALNRLGADIDVDGVWRKETQDAWIQSGKTCAELVPSCTSCPGTYTPGAMPPATPPPGSKPPVQPISYGDKKETSSPWPWILGGLAVAGIAGIVVMSASTPASKPAQRVTIKRVRR